MEYQNVTTQIDVQAKFLGGMIGSAVGDAIGELAFSGGGKPELQAQVENARLIRYTDDTAMAIGLAESLSQKGALDQDHLGDTFRRNYEQEPWRGYAIGPPTIFRMVKKRGMSYQNAAESLFDGTGSFGNGAAMRIVPVGLFFHNASNLYEQAQRSASVTHAHPIGVDGAAVLAWAIAQVVKLRPQDPFPVEEICQGLINVARTSEIQEKMERLKILLADNISPSPAADRLGRSVAVHESMPFALYAFLRNPHSFEACLYCAVLNGGDRDTLGAMACAVSGAYLGLKAIPHLWREKLENRRYIENLAQKLAGIRLQ
jgi:poly(ADP-ribose) glycohydrolase ARH3